MNKLITIENLNLDRGPRSVLRNLSLDVAPGERIVIRGENGSGKTSLLKAVLGLLPPASGSIRLKDREVGSRQWRGIRRAAAWVPQEGVLHRFPVASHEVVEVGLAGMRMNRREREVRVSAAMESAGASHLNDRCYHRLSGGEKQRISIARCLAQGAEVLLLDEPAAALDAESRLRLMDLIAALEDIAIVAVTHEDGVFSGGEWNHLKLEGGRLC